MAIPEKGRKVRCSKCAFVWIAKPPAIALAPAADAPGDLDDIVISSEGSGDETSSQAQATEPPATEPPSAEPLAVDVSSETPTAEPSAEPEMAAETTVPKPDASVRDIYEAEDNPVASDDADMDIEFAAGEFMAATAEIDLAGESAAGDAGGGIATDKRRRTGFSTGVAAGWVLLLAAVSGLGMAAIAERERVVAALPGSAAIYERLGMPVNVRGLEFRKVAYGWSAVAGRQLLEISGEVINVSNRPRSVPMIEFALRNAEDTEVYQWAEEVRSGPLPAGQATTFKASLDSPPKGVVNLQVRFTGAR